LAGGVTSLHAGGRCRRGKAYYHPQRGTLGREERRKRADEEKKRLGLLWGNWGFLIHLVDEKCKRGTEGGGEGKIIIGGSWNQSHPGNSYLSPRKGLKKLLKGGGKDYVDWDVSFQLVYKILAGLLWARLKSRGLRGKCRTYGTHWTL